MNIEKYRLMNSKVKTKEHLIKKNNAFKIKKM